MCAAFAVAMRLSHFSSHLSLNCESRWGTTGDFPTSFLHFSLFSTALWDLPNSRPVHSMMLSSHLFLCLPCLFPPSTVPCKMVLARPDEWETWRCHCSLHLFTMVRRSLCCPIACWILARTSSLVTWSLYEMRRTLWKHLISMACFLLWSNALLAFRACNFKTAQPILLLFLLLEHWKSWQTFRKWKHVENTTIHQ